jgi:hypothetical protein
MDLAYTSHSPNISATFDIIWGRVKPLDSPNGINILIYRCKEMTYNCGNCLSQMEKFECSWCKVKDK